MSEFLLEVLSEEIPARMQARAADDLKRLVTEKIKSAGLEFSNAESFVTPRRLTLVVDGLPIAQPDIEEERKGPQVDAPEKAIQGFLNSIGLSLDQCEKRNIKGKEFWFAKLHRQGQQSKSVLSKITMDSLTEFRWPKSMRWSNTIFSWVRPIHSILAIFNSQLLPVSYGLGVRSRSRARGQENKAIELQFGNTTRGHRFLAPASFAVNSFAEYQKKLREAFVMLTPAERRAAIAEGAAKLAEAQGLLLKRDEGLLDEVTGLVEWPVPLMGSIDQSFMDVPPEVLTTAMRAHQKYFALETPDGRLAPRFVVIANMLTEDGGKQIVAGNERVLRARLSDARFFWDQDRKQPLESRVPALGDIVFHAKLGTVAAKVERIQVLAAELCEFIPGAERDPARSAALLAKADLTTGMVGEFPELQGIMGRYYALHDGEKPAVADAIAEHYSPKGPDDKCPTAPLSVAVALADKIDTLVGFFAIDEKPTGSRDPFALRRAALGVIRLVLENKLRVPLLQVFDKALATYPDDLPDEKHTVAYAAASLKEGKTQPGEKPKEPRYYVAAEVLDFFADRLKVTLREKGVRHDLIDAVFSLGGEDDLVRLMARVDALNDFLASDDGRNLLIAYRRASNIVAIEEKKDKASYADAADAQLLSQPEEKALAQALAEGQAGTKAALAKEDFTAVMTVLARLRGPVDTFFDKVTVNAEDKALRANRLRLLSQIRATLGAVADFSRVEG